MWRHIDRDATGTPWAVRTAPVMLPKGRRAEITQGRCAEITQGLCAVRTAPVMIPKGILTSGNPRVDPEGP